jgi:23S rRNA pseudouridine1911/1915/1917 synthase
VNDGFSYVEQVGPDESGRSVLEHLARTQRHSTADEWCRRIEAGEVELDGARACAADRMRAGQRLVWNRPPWEEPAAPLDFAVIYRDDDLLAVAKPRGLPTMAAGGFHTHTLQWQVRRRYPEAVAAHRLGRGTSGLVLFARSEAARRGLPRAWAAGAVVRRYRGLVAGPMAGQLTIDTPIGLVPHPRLGRVHAACPAGKAARSHVRALATGDDASASRSTSRPGGPIRSASTSPPPVIRSSVIRSTPSADGRIRTETRCRVTAATGCTRRGSSCRIQRRARRR